MIIGASGTKKVTLAFIRAGAVCMCILAPNYALAGLGDKGNAKALAKKLDLVHCNFVDEHLLANSVDSCENAGGIVEALQAPEPTLAENPAIANPPVVLMYTQDGRLVQIPYSALKK